MSDDDNNVTLPNWIVGAGLVIIAALGAGLVFALSSGKDATRYEGELGPAQPALGEEVAGEILKGPVAVNPDAPAATQLAQRAGQLVDAAGAAANATGDNGDKPPLNEDTSGIAGRLFTSTGDDAKDEALIARAKLMGLGHKPVAGDDDSQAPDPTPPPPSEESAEEAPPHDGPITKYLSKLDRISAGLKTGQDPNAFAEEAVQAAAKGDNSALVALKKRYEDATKEVLALHTPPAATEHKAATLEVFAAATGMLGRLVVAMSSGDVASMGTLGDDAKALQKASERVDKLTADLMKKAAQ